MSQDRFYRRIYMDHAATTEVDPRVLAAMLPFWSHQYGNPSSLHWAGREAGSALGAAREQVASILGARPAEILFTSCGTESDNLALRGIAAAAGRPIHIITSSIEHHAVLHTCQQLQAIGHSVTYLPVTPDGLVDPEDVRQAIQPDTGLISIMAANNEVGTIQPIAEISAIAQAHGVPLHSDAVQAAGALDLDVDVLGVDLLALSGHKFHAPKGVGLLYVRQGTRLTPSLTGGAQERGLRAGTENVAFAVGVALALDLAYQERKAVERVQRLRDRLVQGVMQRVPDTLYTGHPTKRLPSSASFCFEGIDGEALLLHLDLAGIAASSGSACSSGAAEPSHVLLAMGIDRRLARGSLRLTLGRQNSEQDVEDVLQVLPEIVARLRQMSPVYHSA